MAEEWGPWIENDGSGCPVPVGTFVRVEMKCGLTSEGRVTPETANATNWLAYCQYGGPDRPKFVRRYQVRRPRGMEVLDRILAKTDLPVKEDA